MKRTTKLGILLLSLTFLFFGLQLFIQSFANADVLPPHALARRIVVFVQSYFDRADSFRFLSLAWTISGIAFCVTACLSGNRAPLSSRSNLAIRVALVLAATLFISYVYMSVDYLGDLFQRNPVDLKGSDVIPTLQVFVQRFLEDRPVYTPIQYSGYTSIPTYLPFTWLPYVPAEVFAFDYRWVGFWSLIATLVYMAYRLYRKNPESWWTVIFLVLAGTSIYSLSITDEASMKYASEYMICAYYLVFCLTLFSKRASIVALGIILCLLSRYTIVLWLPFYFIAIWRLRGLSFVVKTVLMLAAGVMLFYILPFLGMDITIFTDGLQFYSSNALSKWQAFGWQADGAIPYHLKQGLGLAVYYYEAFHPDNAAGIQAIRWSQLIGILLVGVTGLAIVLRPSFNQQRLQSVFAAITVLFLIVFYSFIHAPYRYLFLLPMLAGLAVIWWLGMEQDKRELA